MPPPLEVLGFGAVAVDELIFVDGPLSAGKARVTGRQMADGGNVATALSAVARLGGRAGFIGWVGDGPEAEAATNAMETEGVDLSFAPVSPGARPIQSIIIVGSDGERFIAYDDDTLIGAPEALDDAVFRQAKILIVDGFAIGSMAVVDRARALGVEIVGDIEWSVGEDTEALMRRADHLVIPWDFACQTSGETDPRAVLSALWPGDRRVAVVLTRGAEGSYICQRDDPTLWHVPAFPVEAVDTTGAGDCFHGAYAFAVARGQAPLDAAHFASAAAAISTTGPGGRGALPTAEACRALMDADGAPRPEPLAWA